MATKTPLPHVVRASALAHDLFAPKDDAPPVGSAYKNLTLSVPLGLAAVLDALAARAGHSRSATAAQLMQCGFGLVMQQLTPAKRAALHAELEAMHIDTTDVLVPASATFDVEA